MSKDIKVSPTPIQRNTNDVAVELTQLYCENHVVESAEELQELYAKFYAVANTVGRVYDKNLIDLLPTNLQEIYKAYEEGRVSIY